MKFLESSRQKGPGRGESGSGSGNGGGTIALAVTASVVKTECLNDRWYLDSASSDCMCNDESKFSQISKSPEKSVKVGNGDHVNAAGTGSVAVTSILPGGRQKLSLSSVLFVPDLFCNLVSVSQLTERGVSFTFDKYKAVATLNGKTIFTADKVGRMYEINFECNPCDAGDSQEDGAKSLVATGTLNLWHNRLGHVHHAAIKRIPALAGVRGSADAGEVCETCVKGKMHKRPLPSHSKSRASRPLELVHSDVMGPFTPTSLGGSCYVVTFIDDYSRYVVVRPMKSKDEVLQKFKEYKALYEAKLGEKIGTLRSDFGGEYCSKEFESFLAENGITHQKSIPHTHGRAERMNRTLLECARCMLMQSSAPKKVWAEAINTAAHVRNRCPSRSIDFKLPIQLFLGVDPTIEELQVLRPFGCRVQALDEEAHSKLDSKSLECILLGYEEGTKGGYRLLNLKTERVIVRRDAVLHEDSFPLSATPGQGPARAETDGLQVLTPFDMFLGEEFEHGPDAAANPDEPAGPGEGEPHPRHADPDVPEAFPLPEDEAEPDAPGEVLPAARRSGRACRPTSCGCPACLVAAPASDGGRGAPVEPASVKEAMEGPYRAEWEAAMKEEFGRLTEMETWELVPRPPGVRALGCSWKFKLKCDSVNECFKFKARLVAQGFAQKHGLDYYDTYSPVVKRKSIRLMLALSVELGLCGEHIDVVSAYVNTPIPDIVFMEQPKQFEVGDRNGTVCRLKKCLYGLKQSGREWYRMIKTILTKLGFLPTIGDPCLFYHKLRKLYVFLYVDDLGVWGGPDDVNWLKSSLALHVETRNLGEIRKFLSLRVRRPDCGTIMVDQSDYIHFILETFNMTDCKEVSNPLSANVLLGIEEPDAPADQYDYRKAIGMLLFVANCSRPDLSFAVSFLSQFCSNPSRKHWAAVKHLLRYLKGTASLCIIYHKCEKPAVIYSDADFASNKVDRKSFSGMVTLFAGGAVNWQCKKQTVVAMTTQESEYIALSISTRESLWLSGISRCLKVKFYDQHVVMCDNIAAITLASDDVIDDKSKAIDVRYHFVKDVLKKGLVKFMYVPSALNCADLLTKGLSGAKTQQLCSSINLKYV